MSAFQWFDVKSEIHIIREETPAISATLATKVQKVAGIAEVAVAESSKTNAENYSEPYIDKSGTLIIPFDSHPRYQWWKEGQDVYATLKELNAPLEIIKRYVPEWFLEQAGNNEEKERASFTGSNKGSARGDYAN